MKRKMIFQLVLISLSSPCYSDNFIFVKDYSYEQQYTVDIGSDGNPVNGAYSNNHYAFRCMSGGVGFSRVAMSECSEIAIPPIICESDHAGTYATLAEINGLNVGMYWRGGGLVDGPVPMADRYGSDIIPKGSGTGIFELGAEHTIIISCTQQWYESESIKNDRTGQTLGNLLMTYRFTINLRSNNGSVVLFDGPTEIVGRVGEIAESSMTLRVPSNFVGGLNLSWDINEGEVCKNWNPSLRNASGGNSSPGIGVDHVSTFALVPGDNPLVATFVPTELGGFTCHGTLRVSID
jgi:hypothetical protein